MKKSLATLIDEFTVTNIKIYHLTEKKKHTPEDAKKLEDLNKYHSELSSALNKSKAMKKSLATLIEELTVTNIKIFNLVDKIRANKHTRLDAKKAQDLNHYRSELCNSLSREFKERENIKI
ncbi:hypothetical protein A3E66_04420 [Candidatus Daviesbacteria bacterium RIFCSPHIGHO2_12_FULL_37_16]|uniref:Uncharacterized protein n=2 Tax=Candidatus Daviesiibacteriota TaxID=1752718 RepID=A0A0G0EP47_9BACT|nr:MAG: hypothetical protein US19_C0051G0004 [Candidatus Daviesbacteria bacterium GW2011_GWB1_36_5]OGE32561.1 MAG: hypothetical protein A3C99_00260 [Candidatus Daviesbacteria bacterium RIFCSPHIGHO2_02_FULL_37_9]OGE35680.1 MAG: hypothetical protein A3E66_04420 [Candidatus Daviesbacteria bacterium RIFCSPHIGHO2_12_FULL_37_16]